MGRVVDGCRAAWRYGGTAAAAVCLAVLVGWLGDALKGEALFCPWWGWSEQQCRARGWPLLALAGVSLGLLLVLVISRRRLGRMAAVERLAEVQHAPREALLLLLSPPNHTGLRLTEQPAITLVGGQHIALSPAALPALLGQRLPWNWQPVLRAVSAHQSRLIRVVLLGSRGAGGDLDACAQVLKLLWPAARWCVDASPLQPDFSSLCEVRQALAGAVAQLRQDSANDTLRPVINVTGGNKTASIAAAIAAMELDLELEYLEDQRLRAYRIQAALWKAF